MAGARRLDLSRRPPHLHCRSDALDVPDLDQDAVCRAAVPASVAPTGTNPGQLPEPLSPYSDVGPEFLRYMANSVWVSTATTLVGVVVAVPAAYAFSRFRFPGRGFSFIRPAPQHVPGRHLSDATLYRDAKSRT